MQEILPQNLTAKRYIYSERAVGLIEASSQASSCKCALAFSADLQVGGLISGCPSSSLDRRALES